MDNLQTQIADQIRINTAFEQMIVSVLIGASFCSVVFFIVSAFSTISGGYGWLEFIVGDFVNALLYAFVIFLSGFLAAAIVAAPLFVALEKIPYRHMWPYVIAALFFELALYALFFRGFASAGGSSSLFILPMFAPGIIVSVIFGFRMRPFWRAVARAEQAATEHLPRLH